MIATTDHLIRAAHAAGFAPGGMDATFDGRNAHARVSEPNSSAFRSLAAFARAVRGRQG